MRVMQNTSVKEQRTALQRNEGKNEGLQTDSVQENENKEDSETTGKTEQSSSDSSDTADASGEEKRDPEITEAPEVTAAPSEDNKTQDGEEAEAAETPAVTITPAAEDDMDPDAASESRDDENHEKNNDAEITAIPEIHGDYLMLKEKLIAKGQKFSSDTDTEIVAHLFADFYEGDMEEAVKKILKTIEGSYSLVFMCAAEPDKLICTKKDNPLIIGLGEGENFIASDIPAIIAKTRRTYIMSDGEIATVTKDGVWVQDINGTPITKKVFEVNWNAEAAEKGGFEHFMLKEMYEQPKAILDTFSPRIKGNDIVIEELGMSDEEIKAIRKIMIVACGSAYHAGVTAKYVMEGMARIPVETDLASEFRYRDPIMGDGTLVVIISQSGETADSLAALREAKQRGAKVLGIVNVVGSSIAREADNVMYTWAGPEIAVATTKAYSTQLIAAYTLAIQFAKIRGQITEEQYAGYIEELQSIPEKIQRIIEDKERLQWFASKQAECERHFLYRSWN